MILTSPPARPQARSQRRTSSAPPTRQSVASSLVPRIGTSHEPHGPRRPRQSSQVTHPRLRACITDAQPPRANKAAASATVTHSGQTVPTTTPATAAKAACQITLVPDDSQSSRAATYQIRRRPVATLPIPASSTKTRGVCPGLRACCSPTTGGGWVWHRRQRTRKGGRARCGHEP